MSSMPIQNVLIISTDRLIRIAGENFLVPGHLVNGAHSQADTVKQAVFFSSFPTSFLQTSFFWCAFHTVPDTAWRNVCFKSRTCYKLQA